LQISYYSENIDYPKFVVTNNNVRQIDKLAILMGLMIHYNAFKKWYVIVSVRCMLMGMA
jgi:hypothetical protein